MLVAAVPVLAAFARRQSRRKRSGVATLIEPSIFRKRSYVSGAGFAMVFLGSMGGLMLALTALLQFGLGYSPIEASLTSAPYALGGFVGSAIGGMTMARLGRTVLQAGLVINAAGAVVLLVVLEQAGTGVGHFHFTAPLLVAGIGMGMVFVPLFDIILAGVGDHEVGSASGILQALQQLACRSASPVSGRCSSGSSGPAPTARGTSRRPSSKRGPGRPTASTERRLCPRSVGS